MDYMVIMKGDSEPLPIFSRIVQCLENIEQFPYLIEPIYKEALSMSDDGPDRLRFALVRLQVYADIHRYEDMETTQKMKYMAQVLERVIFGSLMIEPEPASND